MSGKRLSGVKFATHYILTPISSETGLPTGKPVRVDNLVLDSGLAALGTPTAYSKLSMGTSTINPDPSQTGLITPVASIDIAQAVTRNVNTHVDGVTVSTITHEVLFKNIKFPSTERNIEISEIGLDGLTRAVYDEPLRIGLKDWVSAVAVLEYTYAEDTSYEMTVTVNGETGEVANIPVSVMTRPDILPPTNRSGRGYGTAGIVTCRVWDGSSPIENPKAATLTSVVVTSSLNAASNKWDFTIVGPWNAMATIKGVILSDTNNAINTLVEYPEGLKFEEDDTVTLSFSFNWSR